MLTIDDRSTRDIDDAIEVHESEAGWIVNVAIADAAKRVTPGSEHDLEARARGATRYFATGNSPMLPRDLAEEKLSLWPHKHKNTILIQMRLSPDLQVFWKGLNVGTICSAVKLSYQEIPEILKLPDNAYHGQISAAKKLAFGLLEKRRANGSMVFYDLNNGWVTTEEGALKQLKTREDTIGYVIIQELMILANQVVATVAVENDVPILFRNHEARSAMPEREALMRQIAEAAQTPIIDLESLQKRTQILLGRATYGSTLSGHYGLNVPAYTHFTSPIRRYADLVNHQQLRAFLTDKPLPYDKVKLEEIAQHLQDLADKERESAYEYFKDKAEKRAVRRSNARMLDGLSAKDFERVVKVELRSGEEPSEGLVEATARRLADGTMPPICMTVILMQPTGWMDLKKAVLAHLTQNPHDSVSLLAQAPTLGDWPEVIYEGKQEGPAHAPVFHCRAWLQTGISTEPVRGKTAKEAKQRAATTLLALLHGLEPPAFQNAPEVKPEAPKAKPEVDPNKNPVSAIMEISQATKQPPPAFAFRLSGPAHAPVVTCTSTFGGHEVTVVAANKQAAKQQACKLLLEKL